MQMVQNQQDNLLLTPGMQVLQLSEYRAAAISLDQHQAELCLLEQMRCGWCVGSDAVLKCPGGVVPRGAQEHGSLALHQAPHGHCHAGAGQEPRGQYAPTAH